MSALVAQAQSTGRVRRLLRQRCGVVMEECSAHPCRRFTMSHRMLRRDGVLLNGKWCCSSACLGRLLLLELSPRETSTRSPSAEGAALRLPLLRRAGVSLAQLEDARRRARRGEGSLESLLLRHGYLREESLARARAAEAGCSFWSGTGLASIPHQNSALPANLAHHLQAYVVHADKANTMVAFAERVDRSLLHAVERMSGTRVTACFVTPSMLQSRLAMVPAVDALNSGTPEQLAQRVVALAVRTGTEEISFGRGSDWAWLRLSCELAHTDLVWVTAPTGASASQDGTDREENLLAV